MCDLQELARVYPSERHFGDKSFQITDLTYRILKFCDDISVFIEIIYNLIAGLNLLFVFQRQRDPAAQKSRTHWRHRLVDHVNERFSVRIRGVQKFEVTDCELVEPHKLSLVDSRKRGDIIYLIVLSLM